MELEELKQAWKELNEKVAQNELTNRSVIVNMLTRQKENCIERLWRLEKGTCAVMIMTTLVFVVGMSIQHWKTFEAVALAAFVLVLTGLSCNVIGLWKVKRIKDGSPDLEEQLGRILRFKLFRKRAYILGYFMLIPFIGIALYYLYSPFFLITLCIILPLAMLIDYFLYQHLSNTVKGISETTRELEEYKQEVS